MNLHLLSQNIRLGTFSVRGVNELHPWPAALPAGYLWVPLSAARRGALHYEAAQQAEPGCNSQTAVTPAKTETTITFLTRLRLVLGA